VQRAAGGEQRAAGGWRGASIRASNQGAGASGRPLKFQKFLAAQISADVKTCKIIATCRKFNMQKFQHAC
jgi:hypothetical protein